MSFPHLLYIILLCCMARLASAHIPESVMLVIHAWRIGLFGPDTSSHLPMPAGA